MLKPGWLTRYGPIILPEYFEQEDEYTLAVTINDWYKTYGAPPDNADDLIAIMGQEHRGLIHSVLMGLQEWDLSYAGDMAITFARQQAAKAAVLESLADVEQGNLELVVERLKEASDVGRDIAYKGIDVVEGVDTWLYEATIGDKVPTGMVHLDIALEGGLGVGELGCFMSPPNYGKSMALVNAGYGAAGIMSCRNVVHFSLEMSDVIVCKRYAARQVFRFPTRGEDADGYKDEFLHVAKMYMPGKVRVFRVTGTIGVLRSHLEILRDEGYGIGLIIVDYADELTPTKLRNNQYEEMGDIFKELRDLGYAFGCPLWTATQTQRSAVNKEVITMQDVADSFKKAARADVLVAICQTREEEENDQCRLFLAKVRDGESRAMVQAKYYKRQQAIITTGFVGRNTGVEVE